MSQPLIPGRDQFADLQRERRAVVRFSYFAQAQGEYVAAETILFFEGRILDLSANGVGLRVHRKLEPGATVSLILKHATGIFQCARTARVVHVRHEDSGSWMVGCEFSVPLTEAEIRSFQASACDLPASAVEVVGREDGRAVAGG